VGSDLPSIAAAGADLSSRATHGMDGRTRVLVIDDDVRLGEILCLRREQDGFDARAAADAQAGLRLSYEWHPHPRGGIRVRRGYPAAARPPRAAPDGRSPLARPSPIVHQRVTRRFYTHGRGGSVTPPTLRAWCLHAEPIHVDLLGTDPRAPPGESP